MRWTVFKIHRGHDLGGIHMTLHYTSRDQEYFFFHLTHYTFLPLSPPLFLSLSSCLSFKVHPRNEKWRAAGWVLPSPCWGQQFTMLIETLTPSLLGAPLHSDKLLFCIAGQTSALPLSRLSLITWLHLLTKMRLSKPLQRLSFKWIIGDASVLTLAASANFLRFYFGHKLLLK